MKLNSEGLTFAVVAYHSGLVNMLEADAGLAALASVVSNERFYCGRTKSNIGGVYDVNAVRVRGNGRSAEVVRYAKGAVGRGDIWALRSPGSHWTGFRVSSMGLNVIGQQSPLDISREAQGGAHSLKSYDTTETARNIAGTAG